MYSSFCVDFINNSNSGDTILQLDGIGYGTYEPATFGMDQPHIGSQGGMCPKATDDVCKLVLGLGPNPSVYSDEHSPSGGSKSKGHTSLFSQRDSILKLGLSRRSDTASNVLDFSSSVQSHFDTPSRLNRASSHGNHFETAIVDEGSTSAKKFGGYMRRLIMAPRLEDSKMLLAGNNSVQPSAESLGGQLSQSSEPSTLSNYSVSKPGCSAIPCSDQKVGSIPRRCKFTGCAKGARGATSLCISHGGGQRCQKPGCNKGAESRTAYCKAHGGGRRCQHLGCTKSAEGKTDHCIAHGGGLRCGHPGGCTKAARGKSGLCIKHGGGKRCKVEGCTRSAEGQVGLCISHGGGRRCHFPGCTKGAQGSTTFCKGHGGGKRCIFSGCSKGAEGSTPLCKGHGGGKRCMFDGGGICPKSVHGGTNFCVAHGGGKRCSVPGCAKSARGRTDCCVRHGGGKRCRADNCRKSAQGSTDFCKAHGGGKRCCWGDGKCEKFARGKSGMCAAHGNLAQKRERSKAGMIAPGLFSGLVPPDNSLDHSSSMSDLINPLEKPAKRQPLIPPQVLVPLSMKASSSTYSMPKKSTGFHMDIDVVPEGRVHGGGRLLSFLGANLKNAINGI